MNANVETIGDKRLIPNPTTLAANLALVPVAHVHPSPLQPRSSVSAELVAKMADSMRAGRHEPLLDVEPVRGRASHYRIVCGEQRWRAARAAGLARVMVRIHCGLSSIERLQRQYEENRLRAGLTAYEEAQLVLLAKAMRDIDVAEARLAQADIPFKPLAATEPADPDEIFRHLEGLKALLLENGINVIKTANGPTLAALSPWRETEASLGISEAARKLKLSVLKLEDSVLPRVKGLPAQHAPLIARVEGAARRTELAAVAARLTHRQLHAAVNRLRKDPNLSVADAVAGVRRPAAQDPLAIDALLDRLGDLCRQLVRLLDVLERKAGAAEQEVINLALVELTRAVTAFTRERQTVGSAEQT